MLTGVQPFAGALNTISFRSTAILSRIRLGAALSRLRQEQHFLSSTIPPILLGGVLYTLQHGSSSENSLNQSALIARENGSQCHISSLFEDTCGYVREHCSDFDDGLIPYFQLFYCAPPAARPVLILCLFLWLMVIIASMATVAGDFLSVHLGVIVSTIGISENLAGVTIFAFGNGSTDLFSTLAAMNANSGSLAIGELFGAAAFITTVVLGLVMMTRPFYVEPKSFVGDAIWFIIAASCLTAFLADGQLALAECTGIIGLYLAFVCYAILRPKPVNRPLSPTSLLDSATVNSEGQTPEESLSSQLDETTRLLSSDPHHPESGADAEQQITYNTASASQTTLTSAPQEAESVAGRTFQPETTAAGSTGETHGSLTTTSQIRVELTDSGSGWSRSMLEMFPPLLSWHEHTWGENLLTLFAIPLLIPIGLSIPTVLRSEEKELSASPVDERRVDHIASESHLTNEVSGDAREPMAIPEPTHRQSPWLTSQERTRYIQFTLGFQLLALVSVSQATIVQTTAQKLFVGVASACLLSAISILFLTNVHHASSDRSRTVANLFTSMFGFTTSLAWIYLTATSIVSLLTTLGFILRIPDAILGATIFAIGNSSNDLVANIAVARRGSPVLAASACFGGPMMNMLLGIGIGGLVQVVKQHTQGASWATARYSFDLSSSMFASTTNLLLGLAMTLAYAFWNTWMLDRRLGIILVTTWVTFTAGSVVMSMVAT